jgi:hypothetical protein
MFRSSWDYYRAVLYNTTRLIELSVWINIMGQRVRIIKVIKIVEVERCVLMSPTTPSATVEISDFASIRETSV